MIILSIMKTHKKNYKSNIGYKQKLISTIFALTTITFIFLTLNRVHILKELMYERIINRVSTLGNILAEEIKDDLIETSKTKEVSCAASRLIQTLTCTILAQANLCDPQLIVK